jgi:two-component system sensor histidine kinase VanS
MRMDKFFVPDTPKALCCTNTEFLAMVAHDLKSPINAEILALKQLLHTDDPSARTALIHDILGAANYMKHLVDNILGKYKLETGIMTMHKGDFCLKNLVSECIEETKYLFDFKTAAFHCKTKNTQINADYFEIKRVIHNLVLNALEHSARDTKIEIELRKKRNEIILSIKNYGFGIADTKAIFSQNFTSGKRAGTGLGLYISKQIIEAHNGTISAQSRGKWVKITFALPV